MVIELNPYGEFNNCFPHKNITSPSMTNSFDFLELVNCYFNKYKSDSQNTSRRFVLKEAYNTKVALWQVPYEGQYSNIYLRHDSDNNSWLEYRNKYNENEFKDMSKSLNTELNKYKIWEKTTIYSDNSIDIVSKYPNGTNTTEHSKDNYVFVKIKDKDDKIIAEDIFNYDSSKGRKITYQNLEKDNNVFTVAKIYSYDTTQRNPNDIVNFGYTNSVSDYTSDCLLEKEYYLLNGEEVDVKSNKKGTEFKVKDKNGNKFKFKVK